MKNNHLSIVITSCLILCLSVIFINQNNILIYIRLNNLKHPNPYIRAEAIYYLDKDDQIKNVIPEIVDCLIDPSFMVQEKAILALNTVGSPAKSALVECLQSNDPRLKNAALQACGLPDPRHSRMFSFEDDVIFIKPVINLCKDSDANVRKNALDSLVWVSIGSKQEKNGIEVIIDCLSDEKLLVRKSAIHAAESLFSLSKKINEPQKLIMELEGRLKMNNGIQEELNDAIEKLNKKSK